MTPGAERVRTVHLLGGREMIKYQAAQHALNAVRLMLGLSRMRLFVAIDLSDEARAAAAAEQKRLAAALGGGRSSLRWVKPDQLHLTLAFLGEVDEARGAVGRRCADERPCDARLHDRVRRRRAVSIRRRAAGGVAWRDGRRS